MINNRGASVSMVWIIIAMAAFITIFILVVGTPTTPGAYPTIMNQNNGTIDSTWLQNYYNISSQRGILDANKSTLDKIVEPFLATGQLIGTVFNYGVSTLRSTAAISQQSVSIVEFINSVIPGLDAVFWFITFAIGTYLTIRLIQEIRGSLIGT